MVFFKIGNTNDHGAALQGRWGPFCKITGFVIRCKGHPEFVVFRRNDAFGEGHGPGIAGNMGMIDRVRMAGKAGIAERERMPDKVGMVDRVRVVAKKGKQQRGSDKFQHTYGFAFL